MVAFESFVITLLLLINDVEKP